MTNAQHTAATEDVGDNLYHVIRRDGVEIGRAWAGGWDDDFGAEGWDEHPITAEEALDRMGKQCYAEAVATGKSIRYDLAD